jgi:hypothetical protein
MFDSNKQNITPIGLNKTLSQISDQSFWYQTPGSIGESTERKLGAGSEPHSASLRSGRCDSSEAFRLNKGGEE